MSPVTMSRRVYSNNEFDYRKPNSPSTDEHYYSQYINEYEQQENFKSQYGYDYNNIQGEPISGANNANEYGASYVNNAEYYSTNTNANSLNADYNQQYSASINTGYPKVHVSPVIHQAENNIYGTHLKPEHSWISAFGCGGFDNEPPLLEELGINFSHIKDKTLASLNPFRKLESSALNDPDLTGPLLFCFLFGTSLLLNGKVHFGYIYGVATLGWLSIFSILNLMTVNGVNFYLTASVLGYCLLPMVLLSAFAVLLKLRGIFGLILSVASVSWCTLSSSTHFVSAFGMQNQQILIAYPIFLLYSCFALMTIF